MLADWSQIRVTPGTRQADRLPHALTEGFFRVDDRDLAARLALLGDLAQHIAFVDSENRIAGSWRKLFDFEPAFALAELVSLPLGEAALRFETALATDWRQADAILAHLARRLQGWLQRLSDLPESPFTRQILLLKSRDDLPRRLAAIGLGEARAGLGRLRELALVATAETPARDAVAEARADQAVLRAAHALLLNVVAALRPTAERTLAERVRSRRIDPALGLLLAELRTFDLVAERMNMLPERLVQYYYREILGQVPRGPAPERLLVRFPPSTIPVLLPAGSRVDGRIADRVWSFTTDTAVKVVPARVTAQAVLRYDTDPRISLNTSLGAITGLRAERFAGEMPPSPRRIFSADAAAPFAMGLEIGSPAFWLAEGTRRIEVDLELQRRSDIAPGDGRSPDAALDMALRDDPELLRAFGFADVEAGVRAVAEQVRAAARSSGAPLSRHLLHEVLARHVLTFDGLRLLLGRIVTGILIDGDPWPSGAYWHTLAGKIAAAGLALSGQRAVAGVRPPLSLIGEAFRREGPEARFVYRPEDVFEMLLGDAFDVTLSTAGGPYRPTISRVRRRADGRGPGITFQIKLDRTAPPIVAPDGAQAPTLTLLASPRARLCPQSFFEPFRIENIFIRVQAEGITALAGYGDDGRIDLGQGFAPFGIRPRDGASFVVTAPEMALKPVSRVRLAIDWADLPGGGAGFARHYARYAPDVALPDPVLVADYLSNDGWKPLGHGARPMYRPEPDGDRLSAEWDFEGEVQGNSVPASTLASPEVAPARGLLRAGAVRLTISGTSGGFLAEAHPAALVAALRPRLWPPGPRPLPLAPFVPHVRAIRLGYTAREVISVTAPDSARPGEQVTQITPFGRRAIYPRGRQADAGIFPQRLGYGAHFVMIEGPGALGPITLLFEMSESGHDRTPSTRVPVTWHYLGPYGWERLPDTALAVDTTDGLMRSGVVALDLPDDAICGSTEMPGAGDWLAAVAGSPDLDNFPILRRVQTNAVWMTGTDGATPPVQPRTFTAVLAPPGVPNPIEVPVAQSRRPPETTAAFKARVAERLRHRQRAITPWDVERIVLDAFPEVWMVTCLPCLDASRPDPAPGRFIAVVVPHAPMLGPQEMPRARLFDPLALRRIETHLRGLVPDGAEVEVRNPGYEILQLRGRVRFDTGGDDGAQAQRLRLDMARELSVWTAPPELGRFGWSVNLAALHARIEALPYVASLSEFSILHLVHNDAGEHVLHDTARFDPGDGSSPRIAAAEPWGLPLSASDHILTSTLEAQPGVARPTGIGGLRVGEMLIVNQGSPA